MLKGKLKSLHKSHYGGVEQRVEQARMVLEGIQQEISRNPTDYSLVVKEGEARDNLKHWLQVECSILRQKSRIKWLTEGDSNSHYFHMSIKSRISTNGICKLVDSEGRVLMLESEIQQEVLGSYGSLLGSSKSSLVAINPEIVRQGRLLSNDQRIALCRSVTNSEIDEALKAIHVDSAPGCDGLNSKFFLEVWGLIKCDIYSAVHQFFEHGVFCKAINCTNITLIPKAANVDSVKGYGPISCCTILYKIIAKVLANRLQSVIVDLIDPAQSGFILGRQLVDNVMLASELVKGYGRKGLSPRCMIKIDLKKAYDSVEWPFMEFMLSELGFPARFTQWVMTCITTISYSVLVNGKLIPPFKAGKGLRQGDPMSPFIFSLSMEYLSRCLGSVVRVKEFSFHPKCKRTSTIPLLFADDLLIFSKGNRSSVALIKE